MKNPMSMALIATAIVVLGLGAMTVAPRNGANEAPAATQAATQAAAPAQAPGATFEAADAEAERVQIAKAMDWQAYDKGLDSAKAGKKYVMVEFFATWCGYCKKMDKEVFGDKGVRDTLKSHFVPVRVTESSENQVNYQGKSVSEKQLTAMHGVSGFPTLVFLDPQGKEIGKIPGYLPPEEMKGILAFISSESYKKMDYSKYKKDVMKS